MQLSRRAVVAAGVAGIASPRQAFADTTFPSRPLAIIAPADPGGGTDQIARLIQRAIDVEGLSPRPFQVINRGGAGGSIALAELVSRHHGDPYAIMATGGGVTSATIAQNSPFQITDAEPIARLTTDDVIIAAPVNSPYQTIEQFLADFRSDPDSITWCGGSAGGTDHIMVGQLTEAVGLPPSKLHYVAYAGAGAASAALIGGQVTVGVNGYSEWRGLAEDGRVRILASASAARVGDGRIPTLREAGVDVIQQNWRGAFVAPGLEPEHLAWWKTLVQRMYESETWRGYLDRFGWTDGYLPADEFRRQIEAQQVRERRILESLGITGASRGPSPMGPYGFPALIGAAAGAAICATVVERLNDKKAVVPAAVEDDDDGGGPIPVWPRFFMGAGLILAYIAALALAGFLIATPVFILALCWLMRSKRLAIEGVAGLALTGGVWALFTQLLSVTLP